jgi:hypothetical protein
LVGVFKDMKVEKGLFGKRKKASVSRERNEMDNWRG